MIVEAKQVDNGVEPKYEVNLQCSNCGMGVDALEYTQGVCSDCGEPWNETRHVAIHVTSIPIFGQTV